MIEVVSRPRVVVRCEVDGCTYLIAVLIDVRFDASPCPGDHDGAHFNMICNPDMRDLWSHLQLMHGERMI